MKTGILGLLAMGLMVGPVASHATAFSDSIPEYNSPSTSDPYPIDWGVIDTFTFGGPYASVTSAAVSGTWGSSLVPNSTAGVDVYVDNILVAQCVFQDPNCWVSGDPFRPWSYTFSAAELATGFLNDGLAEVRIVQTSDFIVRLGSMTLRGEAVSVPEPGTLALLGLGLAGLGLSRRRKAN